MRTSGFFTLDCQFEINVMKTAEKLFKRFQRLQRRQVVMKDKYRCECRTVNSTRPGEASGTKKNIHQHNMKICSFHGQKIKWVEHVDC